MQNNYNYCPYCGRKLPLFKSSEQIFCCFCGKQMKKEKSKKKRVQCTICHKDIDLHKKQIIICSFCGSKYHYSCIYSWLLKFNSCPMCQNVFLNPNLIERKKF